MRNKKPILLLFEDLIEPLNSTIEEFDLISKNIGLQITENFILKGTFVYIISLFESSLTECLKRYLTAFPDKITDGKLLGKESRYFSNITFASDLIEFIIDDFIQEYTYKNVSEIMTKTFSLLGIESNNIEFNNRELIEKKERRNILVHNDLGIDKKYIRNTKSEPESIRNKLTIDEKYIEETIVLLKDILIKTKRELQNIYGEYNREHLIKDIWGYFFDSPLLSFDKYWRFYNGSFQFIGGETLSQYIGSLSSSEKTLLAYFMQNYSPSLCDVFFKFKDLNMQVSTTKMVEIVEIFDKYPLLLQ